MGNVEFLFKADDGRERDFDDFTMWPTHKTVFFCWWPISRVRQKYMHNHMNVKEGIFRFNLQLLGLFVLTSVKDVNILV